MLALVLLVVVVAHWAALFWVAAHWVPLLGIDPEKTIIQRHAQYTPVFVAAQLTIARAWRQPKCPSAEEQMKRMWYICTLDYYSVVNNNATCTTWTDLEIVILNE